jgi:small-conductance mechanosensitive channel
VVIGTDELVVEQITLLYTVFACAETNVKTQTANNVLGHLSIGNRTRTRVARERFSVCVAIDTSEKAIHRLRSSFKKFVLEHERPGGLQLDVSVELVNVVDVEALELQCEVVCALGTWGQDACSSLRSSLRRGWVAALRKAEMQSPTYQRAK